MSEYEPRYDTVELNGREISSVYTDEHGHVYYVDGDQVGPDGTVTHIHLAVLGHKGISSDVDETLPQDDDDYWLSHDELQESIEDGTIQPARIIPDSE